MAGLPTSIRRQRRSVVGARLGSARGDGGGAALVWLILVPTLLLLVWTGIQVAFARYGESMALAAAQAGVRAATSAPADPARAAGAAREFIAEFAASDVVDAQVTVRQDGDAVTVTVTGHAQSVLPGVQWPVTGSASAPMESLAGTG